MPTFNRLRCEVFAAKSERPSDNPRKWAHKGPTDLLAEYQCEPESVYANWPFITEPPPAHVHDVYINLTAAGKHRLYIEVEPLSTFQWGECTLLTVNYMMDGVNLGVQRLSPPHLHEMFRRKLPILTFQRTDFWKKDENGGKVKVTGQMRFNNLPDNDAGNGFQNLNSLQKSHLGQITVVIYRNKGGRQGFLRAPKSCRERQAMPYEKNVTEEDVKGTGISHLIGLQTMQVQGDDPAPSLAGKIVWENTQRMDNRPFLVFNFKYRTQGYLESLGLIQPSMPATLVEATPEHNWMGSRPQSSVKEEDNEDILEFTASRQSTTQSEVPSEYSTPKAELNAIGNTPEPELTTRRLRQRSLRLLLGSSSMRKGKRRADDIVDLTDDDEESWGKKVKIEGAGSSPDLPITFD